MGSQPTRTCSKKVKMLQARSHGFDQLLVGWDNTLKRNLVKTHHFTNKKLYKTKIKLFVFCIVVQSLLWMLSKIKKTVLGIIFVFAERKRDWFQYEHLLFTGIRGSWYCTKHQTNLWGKCWVDCRSSSSSRLWLQKAIWITVHWHAENIDW